MTDLTIVRTAVSPLVILSTLERAHATLAGGDIVLGRQFVDGASAPQAGQGRSGRGT
jgi:hypothetical protein